MIKLICGTSDFVRVLFPKYLILFVTILFICSGGFGSNHLWLTMSVSAFAIMYCVSSFIKGYFEVKSKYFYKE